MSVQQEFNKKRLPCHDMPCHMIKTPPRHVSSIKINPWVSGEQRQVFQSIPPHCKHHWCSTPQLHVESASGQAWVAEQQLQNLNVVFNHCPMHCIPITIIIRLSRLSTCRITNNVHINVLDIEQQFQTF